ncbi:MAG: tetratricopeptide repeat protein [Bacteroidia bacterium]|nr:tetratricopeptide repeat protein [Bacteroidia bacterium]
MKKIVFVFVLIQSCLFAQTNVDSILNYIKTIDADSLKYKALVSLSEYYSDESPEKSISYLEEAKLIALALKNNAFIANVTNDLGNNNYYIGNFEKSIKNYLESMAANEILKNTRGVANMMNNIASVFVEQGSYKKSLEYNFNALKIREENLANGTGKKDEVGMSLGNIGRAYYYMNDYDKAMMYYNKSLKISEETGNKKRTALMYNNIGSVYAEKGIYDKALDYFNKTFSIQYELGNKQMQALSLNNIAEVYYKKNEYKYAIDFYNKALVIAKELGAKDDIKTSYDGLHSCYSDLKDYENAHRYLLLYREIKDSIFNEENSAQLNEMLTKFESDKKQKEIELLQKDNEVHAVFRNSLAVVCILILIVALLLYNRNKVKQKANVDLSKKNKNIEEKNKLIELQNYELSLKNKEITDSIKYAKRLQLAILPPDTQVKRLLPNSFVLYKPKDIVSGDFYWVEQWGTKTLVAAADCTGHGVPGAFMSIVGNNLLQQAVNIYGLSNPNLILNDLNKNISKILHQSEEASSVKDGMDIALLAIDYTNLKLQYSGAYNPLWIIRDNSLIEITGDKHPVGAFVGEELKLFRNNDFDLKLGDTLYIFTDGYADQFGGEKGKKFKYKSLKDLLLSSQDKSMDEQKIILELQFNRWKGNLEQIDDVCIIGIRI